MDIAENQSLVRLRRGEELTAGELCRMILALSVPAIVAQISTIIMQYIDAAMVGRLGAGGSAAIGLVSSTTWLFGGIAMAAGMGFTVQCAQRIGAGDEADARNLMKQGMLLTLAVSVVIGTAGILGSGYLPVWLGGDRSICADASRYFLIFAIFFPIERLGFTAGNFLQSTGNMIIPGMIHVGMCMLDVVFNMFLIFPESRLLGITLPGAGLGVAGAALGTACSYLFSGILLAYAVCVKSPILRLRGKESWKVEPEVLKRALKISVPMALEHSALTIAQIVCTRIVAPLGTISLAANSFAVTAEAFCYMPGYGIAAAATTLVGQSIGAGRRDLAKSFAWLATGLGMCLMTAAGIFMYFFCPYVFAFLTPVAEVQELGARVLRIELLAEPLFAASIVATGALRGAGDTLVPGILNLISMWGVRISIALLLVGRLGLPGVWIGMCIELNVRGILFLIRLARGKWLDAAFAKQQTA